MNILCRSFALFFLGLYIDIFQKLFDCSFAKGLTRESGLTGKTINRMSIEVYRSRIKFIKLRGELDELLKNSAICSTIGEKEH